MRRKLLSAPKYKASPPGDQNTVLNPRALGTSRGSKSASLRIQRRYCPSSPSAVNASLDPSGEIANAWRAVAGWKAKPSGADTVNFVGTGRRGTGPPRIFTQAVAPSNARVDIPQA